MSSPQPSRFARSWQMMNDTDIDDRSQYFFNLTSARLAGISGRWVRPEYAPEPVCALLAQSRRLFVGGAICYDNFVSAPRCALHAVELALNERLGTEAKGMTFGRALGHEKAHPVVCDEQWSYWLRALALPMRNELAHPKFEIAFTPGMAVELLAEAHAFVNHLWAPVALHTGVGETISVGIYSDVS